MSANVEVEYAGNFQVGIQHPRECFAGRFLLEQNLLLIAFKQTGDTGEEPIGLQLTQRSTNFSGLPCLKRKVSR